MKITKVYSNKGKLSLKGKTLATVEEYQRANVNRKSLNSIFAHLIGGDVIELSAGWHYGPGGAQLYELDEFLNVIYSNNSYYERDTHRPGDLENGDWIVHCRSSGEPGSLTARTYLYENTFGHLPDSCPIVRTTHGSHLEVCPSPFSEATKDEILALQSYKALKAAKYLKK
jgi:hypothetical protein